MGLVLVEGGMLDTLDALRMRWTNTRYIGLFQNDVDPWRGMTIGQIVPCDFSGYVGLRLLQGWSPAAMRGERAVSQAAPVVWTHDGGSVSNWIFGYYVVDLSGTLQWAERRPGLPLALVSLGQTCEVVPAFSIGSMNPT